MTTRTRNLRGPIAAVVIAASIAGCAMFTLIEPGRQKVAGYYTVESQIPWSRMQRGRIELWTVDGPGLQALRFFDAVGDGESLVDATSGQKTLPKFSKGMTPNEVQELLVDTVVAMGGASVKATGLRPFRFGALPGFRFDLAFIDKNGLELQGLAAGAIKGDRLYLILYTGARLHYFPRYRDAVERILASVQTPA